MQRVEIGRNTRGSANFGETFRSLFGSWWMFFPVVMLVFLSVVIPPLLGIANDCPPTVNPNQAELWGPVTVVSPQVEQLALSAPSPEVHEDVQQRQQAIHTLRKKGSPLLCKTKSGIALVGVLLDQGRSLIGAGNPWSLGPEELANPKDPIPDYLINVLVRGERLRSMKELIAQVQQSAAFNAKDGAESVANLRAYGSFVADQLALSFRVATREAQARIKWATSVALQSLLAVASIAVGLTIAYRCLQSRLKAQSMCLAVASLSFVFIGLLIYLMPYASHLLFRFMASTLSLSLPLRPSYAVNGAVDLFFDDNVLKYLEKHLMPGVARLRRWVYFSIFLAVVAIVTASSYVISRRAIAGSDNARNTNILRQEISLLQTEYFYIRVLLVVGALLLASVVNEVSLLYQWPFSLIVDQLDSSQMRLLPQETASLAQTIALSLGGGATLVLAALFVPAVLLMNYRAEALAAVVVRSAKVPFEKEGEAKRLWLQSHGLSLSVGDRLTQWAALLAPIIAGALTPVLQGTLSSG